VQFFLCSVEDGTIKKISQEKETILKKAQPIHKGDKTALLGIKVSWSRQFK